MFQTDTAGFVTLQQVVNDVKVDTNDFSERNHKRLIRWAMRGLEKFALKHIFNVKTVKVQVEDNYTIPIPEDMMLLLGVGTVINGEFFGFSQNADMFTKLETVEESFRPANYTDDSESFAYGVNDTYYKLDLNNNRIILSGESYDYVYLKYKVSGISTQDDTFVPVYARDALLAYVKYRMISDDRETPEYIITRKKRDFDRELREMKATQTPTIEQIYDKLARYWTPLPQ